ncbi:hypothetical protein HDU91_005651 [Kappamyces sp. JEL0680]|nr:hypothetical protein HDU91_005651 [Kappamyces sp. JEL0680]
MKAAVFSAQTSSGILVTNLAKPKASETQLLVQVIAVGLNAVDAKFLVLDKMPSIPILHSLVRRLVSGFVPGFDFSAKVVHAPSQSSFQPGDLVFGAMPPFYGSLAEYALVPPDQVTLLPSDLSPLNAACLPLAGLTVLQALEQHNITPQHSVLVIGSSGGVGHLALQVISGLGITVAGICSEGNRAFSESCGASAVFDYTHGSNTLVSNLCEYCKEHGPFDFVLDCVTSNDDRDKHVSYPDLLLNDPVVRKTVLSDTIRFSYVTLGESWTWWLYAIWKRVTGWNLFTPPREVFWVQFPHSSPLLGRLADLASEKNVRAEIQETVPFDQAGLDRAFSLIRERRVKGKIAVVMDHGML